MQAKEPGLQRSTLLKKCIEVLDTFDPKKTTVDAYVDDAPILKDKRIGDVELKFIHQVFYGCVRYQKFLKLFVTSFLYRCPAVALRSEQTLYTVLSYLLFFRLEELGVAELREFLNCGLGTMPALLALLQYCLSVEDLEKWVKVEWCKLYDRKYIEQDIIGKLQSFAAELQPLVAEVEFKATGTIQAGTEVAGVKEKKITSPRPFNLTQPKPRLIPEPEVISREVKALPVPAALNAITLAQVEEEKLKRREEVKAKVIAKYSTEKEFSLETAARRDPGELEELTKKVDAERYAECTFKPAVKKYVAPTEEAVVRQNTAAVLREDAILRQKQAKEYQILKRYEEDLHDAAEFFRWQMEMREKDTTEEEQRVHQRFVEMQLARESAIEAFESNIRRKAILAEHHRQELKVDLEVKEQEEQVELKDKQKLVQDTMEERIKARIAEENITKAKVAAAEQLRREKEAEFEKKRREDELEMEKKKDLIRQLRAFIKVPVETIKVFDPAQPPCMGFLEEMSLAELRERLKIEQDRHAREVEEKRQRQIEKKLEKQQELTEKAETLAKIRARAREETQQRYELQRRRQKEVEEQQQKQREQATEEVAERILQKKRQKREEELRLLQELKEISTKRQFLAANAEMVEAKAHAEQHAGLDREAQCRQRSILIEQRTRNQVKAQETQQRRDNLERDKQEYIKMQEMVDERVRRAKAADTAMKEEIMRTVRSCVKNERAWESRVYSEFGHTSRYIKPKQSTARLHETKCSVTA